MKTIANSEAVISHFGYWPEFADASVLRFLFEAPGVISFTVRYGDAMTGRAGEVNLRFSGVTRAELNELREQNVLDALVVSHGERLEVRLEAAYGLYGSFACDAAAVFGFRVSAP